MSLYLLILVLRGLEILDDLIEIVLAFVDLDAHVQSLAFFLLKQNSLCDLVGLHRKELFPVADVPQQLLPHLAEISLLGALPQLAQLLHAIVFQ
jgi:hypothetical protein